MSAHAQQAVPAAAATAPTALVSGIDQKNVDNAVRVQDDFYMHVNGTWIKNNEIPADKSAWGSFYELRDNSLTQLRTIVEAASKDGTKKPGSEAQQIGDLYDSYMDEKKLDELGLTPLKSEFDKVAALKDKKEIPALIAHFNRVGITAPYDIGVHQDNKDSTKYVVDFGQSGLGLPDRDYYLKKDDAKMAEALGKYQAHITKMLGMSGDKKAAAKAKAIIALETELAKVQWTKVENRDPLKTYNKEELAKLEALTPGYSWKQYMSTAGLDGKVTYVIVSQPTYLTGFAKVLKSTPLAVWKDYFAWHVLSSNASYLGKAYSDENFAFYGTALNGVPQQQPRWKRAINVEETAVGEGLGKLYVAQYFPPESKVRMEKLVANLLEAYRQSIDTLDWMTPATKKEAQTKLSSFMTKIGYPSKWRDYSALTINKDDLIGNVRRAAEFEYQRNINKLGQPIDRAEWGMTPQTVNAYYNPELNEIVFPAAILQPPFFNFQADDAVNYGAIGAVIGHEISHGFDDQGAQYDGAGNLRDWWTKEDHERFAAKTKALVKQYSAYAPVPGYNVNGELTLGENIADNSGLAIAYKAYKLSLGGKEAPVIDGLTGDQRFYLGFGQVWRAKTRDNAAIVRIKTDPHSPPQFRGNGTVKNQPGFYSAFGVKEGDAMYLPPDQRVIMW
ncbi:MAG TPA: M13-type metalloendopeptidase [Burkholderiaceae bacterium]|jgi:predicted metalloendopeptidase